MQIITCKFKFYFGELSGLFLIDIFESQWLNLWIWNPWIWRAECMMKFQRQGLQSQTAWGSNPDSSPDTFQAVHP